MRSAVITGKARLGDPVAHQSGHRHAGCGRQRLPQVVAGGAAIGKVGQVAPKSRLEMVRPDPGFQLPQDASALAVDDRGRAGGDGHLGVPRHFDGEGLVQGVTGQRRLGLASDKLVPDFPVGVMVVDHAIAEIGGKAFVEPEVFPLFWGHQVAEPLMGDLMGDDFTDAGLGLPRGHAGNIEQQVFAKGDRPPVFHGPEGKVGHGDQVHLGERVVDGIVVFAVGQRLAAEGPAEFGLVAHPRQADGPHPGVDAVRVDFERPHTEKKQVGGHFGGRFEGDPAAPVVQIGDRPDIGVGNGGQIFVDHHFHGKNGFSCRMVQAGKGPPGIAFLELGDGDMVRGHVRFNSAAVKAGHAVVDFAGVVDGYFKRAGQGGRRVDAQVLLGRIQRKRAIAEARTGTVRFDPATPDGQFLAIEIDGVGRLIGRGPQDHPAVKGKTFKIGLDGEPIVLRCEGNGHADLRCLA